MEDIIYSLPPITIKPKKVLDREEKRNWDILTGNVPADSWERTEQIKFGAYLLVNRAISSIVQEMIKDGETNLQGAKVTLSCIPNSNGWVELAIKPRRHEGSGCHRKYFHYEEFPYKTGFWKKCPGTKPDYEEAFINAISDALGIQEYTKTTGEYMWKFPGNAW